MEEVDYDEVEGPTLLKDAGIELGWWGWPSRMMGMMVMAGPDGGVGAAG